MSHIENYKQFKSSQSNKINALVAQLCGVDEETHWDLIDDMKGVLGAAAANESSENENDQDEALSTAESWVTDNCSGGGLEEDVAMALWLRGMTDGEAFLLGNQKMEIN